MSLRFTDRLFIVVIVFNTVLFAITGDRVAQFGLALLVLGAIALVAHHTLVQGVDPK